MTKLQALLLEAGWYAERSADGSLLLILGLSDVEEGLDSARFRTEGRGAKFGQSK